MSNNTPIKSTNITVKPQVDFTTVNNNHNQCDATREPDATFLDFDVSYDKALEFDVERAAVHEAGHYLVAKHLGFEVKLRLWIREVDPNVTRVCGGQCTFEFGTNFQRCCIGWGGTIAENLRDDPDWLPEDLELENLDDPELCDVSASDARCIRSHPQKLRAATVAMKAILSQQEEFDAILASAREHLLTKKEKEFTVLSFRRKSMRAVDGEIRCRQRNRR